MSNSEFSDANDRLTWTARLDGSRSLITPGAATSCRSGCGRGFAELRRLSLARDARTLPNKRRISRTVLRVRTGGACPNSLLFRSGRLVGGDNRKATLR
jgi:hypothetical protein